MHHSEPPWTSVKRRRREPLSHATLFPSLNRDPRMPERNVSSHFHGEIPCVGIFRSGVSSHPRDFKGRREGVMSDQSGL